MQEIKEIIRKPILHENKIYMARIDGKGVVSALGESTEVFNAHLTIIP